MISMARRRRILAIGLAWGLCLSCLSIPARAARVDQIMHFAADMAKRGNWREARYRWSEAAKAQPNNSRILNNLAVAWEALGQPEKAAEAYDAALGAAGDNPLIEGNRARFGAFWSAPDEEPGGRSNRSRVLKKAKGSGKPLRVDVGIVVPARLETETDQRVLVSSFLTEESTLIDTNREFVRYLRSAFRKDTDLSILDVNPPPAIPEQTREDLVANQEFWRHLGRSYEADWVVSGVIEYQRRDYSGFRDVDVVSPTTGQKVRQTRYVEQEKFVYDLEVFFFDGATGELVERERVQQTAIFGGSQNDPITAFFELCDAVASDVLSIVSPQTRYDPRVIFRRR